MNQLEIKECPKCSRFFYDSGTYCSDECLNKDLPFSHENKKKTRNTKNST